MINTIALLHPGHGKQLCLSCVWHHRGCLTLLEWEHLAPQILASSTPRLSFFPVGQTSYCMTPFHSTAADHASTRAVEKETLPAPQTQSQRETKKPWDTHCPAQPPSWCPTRGHPALLEILPAEWHPGGSQCFGGSFSALQHPLSKMAKVPLDWGMLRMPIARPGVLQLVWTHRAGGLIAMCGCHYSSISLEAQLGNAFLGRGMAGGRQGRVFSP